MEHNIKIEGQVNVCFPDLIKAAEIIASTFTGKVAVPAQSAKQVTTSEVTTSAAINENISQEPTETIASGHKEVSTHYGQKADGTVHEKWRDMCKALDKAGPDRAPAILVKYSDNCTYDGVKPAYWDKVIKECMDKPVEQKTYSLEDVRALARRVQTEKGKETLHGVFQEFNRVKLSEFAETEYAALYDRLSKEVA